MSKGLHTFINDERGQTMVEFALIVALLITILFGIAEFGRAWFYSNHLTNSVRAAARYGAVLPDTNVGALANNVETYLTDEIDEFMNAAVLDANDIEVRVLAPDGTLKGGNAQVQSGDTIEVTVTYDFDFLVGSYFLGRFSKDATWPLTRTASMQYE